MRHIHRLVMTHLVPINLVLGRPPRHTTLEMHGLEDAYAGMVSALRTGDLRAFEATVAAQRQFFLRQGVYLLIQQSLRNLVLRSLVRRVYLLRLRQPAAPGAGAGAGAGEARSALSVSEVTWALRFCQYDADDDEAECLLANLIAAVRGPGRADSRLLHGHSRALGMVCGAVYTRTWSKRSSTTASA
jgi:hypothetical protein